jgi:hypothetical protein
MNPVWAGGFDYDPIQVACVEVAGGYANVGAGNKYWIVDISDPVHPVGVGSITLGSVHGVASAADYAYSAGGSDGLHVVSIADPSLLVEVGFYDTPGSTVAVDAAGGYIYAADGSGGLVVLQYRQWPRRFLPVVFRHH